MIIEQYRPPVGNFVVGQFRFLIKSSGPLFQIAELPAGLIDDGETPEEAAIRELQEETGYEAEGVLDSSAVLAADPGLLISILPARTPFRIVTFLARPDRFGFGFVMQA